MPPKILTTGVTSRGMPQPKSASYSGIPSQLITATYDSTGAVFPATNFTVGLLFT